MIAQLSRALPARDASIANCPAHRRGPSLALGNGMLSSPSRTTRRPIQRALASFFLLASVLAVVGCSFTREEGFDACFNWPAEVDCPSEDVAVLYMGNSMPNCSQGVVSIDKPPEHRNGKCCYLITVEVSTECGVHF